MCVREGYTPLWMFMWSPCLLLQPSECIRIRFPLDSAWDAELPDLNLFPHSGLRGVSASYGCFHSFPLSLLLLFCGRARCRHYQAWRLVWRRAAAMITIINMTTGFCEAGWRINSPSSLRPELCFFTDFKSASDRYERFEWHSSLIRVLLILIRHEFHFALVVIIDYGYISHGTSIGKK